MLSTPVPKLNTAVKRLIKVKICGIMQPDHAYAAAQNGADMVGVVFAESRRQVSIETALAIRDVLGYSSMRPSLVGVFVNETPGRMLAIARKANLDKIQLSGDETPDTVAFCARHIPVIRALRFPAGTSPDKALAVLDAYTRYSLGDRLHFLVDAYHPLEYGGTGQVADWSLAAYLAQRHDVILAGGLSPANVQSAIYHVSPWGVDVSSGVEKDGSKDIHLIKTFISAAHLIP